jgi:DNA polymerase III sliding clamp (beta) subunit (PCNA family)
MLTPAVVIEASKEGVKFSCQGDIGNGSVTIRQHTNVDKPEQNVAISLSEPVALTFSLKYLVNFCKASNLSSSVVLHLSQEVPLLVEYGLGSGHLRFYLAPKVNFVFQCVIFGNRANVGCQHRSVTKSKQTIRGLWGDMGYAKMKLYDNGERG